MEQNIILADLFGGDEEEASKSLATVEKSTILDGIGVVGPTRLIPDEDWIGASDYEYTLSSPDPYENHPWVHAAVRSIALNISGVPTALEMGSKDNPTPIDEESSGKALQLYNVLQRPNELMTEMDFMNAVVTFLNIDGWCVVVLDRSNPAQIPKQMYPFSGTMFSPIISPATGGLMGWDFYNPSTSSRIQLAAYQVVVIKFFHPRDPFRGLAPLQAAARGLTLDFLSNVYNQAFFENNAAPDGIISFDRALSKKQRKEITEAFEQRHRGAYRARKVGVITGGGKYQATSISQRDMEYTKQKEMTRHEILAVFKVPETEISMYQDVAHANAISQNKAFWNKTLIPIGRLIQSAFTVQLIRPISPTIGKGLRYYFDFSKVPALQEDYNEKITNAERLYRIGFTINDINRRLQLGMDNVPWGDNWYPNRSVAPIDQIISGEANGTPTGPSTTSEPENDNSQDDSEPVNDEADQNNADDEKVLNEVVTIISKEMAKDLRTYLYRLRSYFLSCIRSENNTRFSSDRWDEKLTSKVWPYYASACKNLIGKTSLKFQSPTADFSGMRKFNAGVLSKLAEVLEDSGSKESTINKVRYFFNGICSEKTLRSLCEAELRRAILSWCQ